ncbi:MAG: Cof-type HAD-IIB family hydrolase [Bacillota bacterium]
MYKLAVFDLDGTLLNNEHEISDENMASIEILRKQGCKITIATGRTDLLVKDYVKKLKLDEPVIACNGALVRNPFTKETVYKRVMPPSVVKEIIEICKRDHHIFMVYTEEYIVSTHNHRVAYFEERNKKLEPDCRVQFVIEDDPEYISSTFEVYKILILEDDKERFDALPHKFKNLSGISLCQSNTGLMDIMVTGASKKNALEMLAKSENIRPSEIVAFGDNYNDIEILKYAGCAITTENGVESVKEIADYISIDHNLSGVAYAIQHYLMKK